MNILSIFNTGGLTLALSIIALFLISLFGYRAYMNFHYYRSKTGEKIKYARKEDRPKWYKNNYLKLAIAVLVLYIIAMLVVASDYRGV